MNASASFDKIVAYLENLGSQHTDVQDVFRWNKLEMAGALRNGVNLPAMLIDSVEVIPDNPNSKVVHKNICAFTILGHPTITTAHIDDYENQNTVLAYCQKIAFEIYARMLYDASLPANKWLYNNIKADSFHFFKVGPTFTNQLYGYRCEFAINQIENVTVDLTKWNDIN